MQPRSFKITEKKKPVNTLVGVLTKPPTHDSRTTNNAIAHSTTGSKALDFFSQMGAARAWSAQQKIDLFLEAFDEDPLIAMQLLFWLRDARGGAGERQSFKDIYAHLVNANTESRFTEAMVRNMELIPKYGRWDDLWNNNAITTDEVFNVVVELIKKGLAEGNGLLAKWLPRKGLQAVILRNALEMGPAEYRKLIVGLSTTVEQQMSAGNWEDIKFEHVPSVAMNKYRSAFYKRQEFRFSKYIEAVNKGEKKINASVLFPHLLYQAFNKGQNEDAILAQWNAMPNYVADDEDYLPIIDVSGSMAGLPMDVAISLGLYMAEKNKGAFKDFFVTFSAQPKFIHAEGNILTKFRSVRRAGAGFNTNIMAVFQQLLKLANGNRVQAKDMPTKVIILSDMQFDGGAGVYQSHLQRDSWNTYLTNYEAIKAEYRKYGYTKPTVVFWNLRAVQGTQPITQLDHGNIMVSGFSPTLLKDILGNKRTSPTEAMLEVLAKYSDVIV